MKDLSTGNVGSVIFRFTLPMLAGNIFHQLYHIIDMIIVGRFLGKDALAAIGPSYPVTFALSALIIGITTGFGIVVSQYFGAKQIDNVKRTAGTMFISMGLASIAMTLLGIALRVPIFKLLQLPGYLMPSATTYLSIVLCGTIFMFAFNGISAVLRGLGDSKTPLVFLIASTIINILLDLLFIIVFGWGIAGAALATVLAEIAAFIAVAIYINKTHQLLSIRVSTMVFDKQILKQGIRIGLPTGLQQTFVALGMMALMGIVNTFGTNVIAAYSIGVRIDSFVSLPAMAFSAALSTFVGQNLGAGKNDRVKKGLISTIIMSSAVCVVITGLIIVFRQQLMGLFNSDPDVIHIGADYLTIVNMFYLLFNLMFVFHGVARGAGATLVPMFISVLSLWIIRVPFAAILSKPLGETGIWWSVPIAWVFGFGGALVYYLSGKWKNKIVVKQTT